MIITYWYIRQYKKKEKKRKRKELEGTYRLKMEDSLSTWQD